MVGLDDRGSEAGGRPRSIVPFGPAQPLACILFAAVTAQPNVSWSTGGFLHIVTYRVTIEQ